MKPYFFIATFLISTASFASKTPINFEGTYQCTGNEVGTEAAFTCQMTIKKTGETYASTCSCSDGNTYSGTGIYDKKHHRLSTGFINPQKAEETGISVTNIKKNGKLVSAWTYLNKTTVGHTQCVKQ